MTAMIFVQSISRSVYEASCFSRELMRRRNSCRTGVMLTFFVTILSVITTIVSAQGASKQLLCHMCHNDPTVLELENGNLLLDVSDLDFGDASIIEVTCDQVFQAGKLGYVPESTCPIIQSKTERFSICGCPPNSDTVDSVTDGESDDDKNDDEAIVYNPTPSPSSSEKDDDETKLKPVSSATLYPETDDEDGQDENDDDDTDKENSPTPSPSSSEKDDKDKDKKPVSSATLSPESDNEDNQDDDDEEKNKETTPTPTPSPSEKDDKDKDKKPVSSATLSPESDDEEDQDDNDDERDIEPTPNPTPSPSKKDDKKGGKPVSSETDGEDGQDDEDGDKDKAKNPTPTPSSSEIDNTDDSNDKETPTVSTPSSSKTDDDYDDKEPKPTPSPPASKPKAKPKPTENSKEQPTVPSKKESVPNKGEIASDFPSLVPIAVSSSTAPSSDLNVAHDDKKPKDMSKKAKITTKTQTKSSPKMNNVSTPNKAKTTTTQTKSLSKMNNVPTPNIAPIVETLVRTTAKNSVTTVDTTQQIQLPSDVPSTFLPPFDQADILVDLPAPTNTFVPSPIALPTGTNPTHTPTSTPTSIPSSDIPSSLPTILRGMTVTSTLQPTHVHKTNPNGHVLTDNGVVMKQTYSLNVEMIHLSGNNHAPIGITKIVDSHPVASHPMKEPNNKINKIENKDDTDSMGYEYISPSRDDDNSSDDEHSQRYSTKVMMMMMSSKSGIGTRTGDSHSAKSMMMMMMSSKRTRRL